MSEQLQGYCIGKASRYDDGEIVQKPPYDRVVPLDLYDLLRSAIYPTCYHAELACLLATEFNPVAFVVLRVQQEDCS